MSATLNDIPSFCSHEHWGSIAAIGHEENGYVADLKWGALPTRDVGLMDLLVDPYLGGHLAAAGDDCNAPARQAGHADIHAWGKAAPADARNALAPAFDRQRTTGAYQCLRRGIRTLYDVDIDDCGDLVWTRLDAQVGQNYSRLFAWYKEARAKARFTRLIRPMWPELYFSDDTSDAAAEEKSFTDTVMRVDAFMDMWKPENPRRDRLAQLTGVDPDDADSWRAFLAGIFEQLDGGGAVGTKQAQAYSRPLEFHVVKDKDVTWRGDLDPDQVRTFQDWVMHECFRLTEAREWPHQCHVGTHNLPASQPLPLGPVARRYPGMKLVLIHCWPYLDEAGWLAKYHANVYLDACWQVILNPHFFRRALDTWLGYVPLDKLTAGHDATSVEMAAGAASEIREILANRLRTRASTLGFRDDGWATVAPDILHNNAVSLYGIDAALS